MICKQCGHDNSIKRVERDPWCMYQVQGSNVVSQLFDPIKIPDGWYDSPKAAREALIPPKVVKPPTTSRKVKKRKASNGNSSRLN